MKFQLQLDTKKIEKKLETDLKGLVQKIALSIDGDTKNAGVIPYDKGDLQRTSYVSMVNNDVSEILYPQKYAVKMWYGEELNFQKTHNTNATHHWALPYMQPKRLNAYAKAFLKMKGY